MTSSRLVRSCALALSVALAAGVAFMPTGKGQSPSTLPSAGAFMLTVIPPEEPVDLHAAVPGQRMVFLVAVSETGTPGGPVTLTVSGTGLDAIEAPATLEPGVVGEVTVIPAAPTPSPAASEPSGVATPLEPRASVTITATRDGVGVSEMRTIPIVPEEDQLGPAAADVRDLFIGWLATQHPELGIDAATTWDGTLAGARLLVVEHYLFFSSEWEMGVSWHVMIEPYDWARIYLRRRGVELEPSFAAEITSVAQGDAPHEIEPPGSVDR
jgi:hypothetical protein